MIPQLEQALTALLEAGPQKIVLSAPQSGQPLRKVEFVLVEGNWKMEKLTATQAFHQWVAPAQLPQTIGTFLPQNFGQLTAFTGTHTHALRVTKKQKVLTNKTPLVQKPLQPAGHNRQKNYLLPQGKPIAPLVDMGIFTPAGQVVKAMYDKYRQVNRFVELVEDALKGTTPKTLQVVDFGSGKSYLTFVLYYYLVHIRGIEAHITGLDLKADVVEKCNQTARRYGYRNLHFKVGDIAAYTPAAPVDMVITLHACDTATDLALAHAVAWQTPMIFSVPCCQHQLNGQMQSDEFAILTRYGLVQERVAALFTDAIRANLLTACGYKTQLVEFVGFEHTPKNIMIRAQKAKLAPATRQKALEEVQRLAKEFNLQPELLSLLQQKGLLPCADL